jgi:hypothetical protein
VKPPFDPWLAHLRRDRRGLPVPYINLWGVEDPARFSVRHDPHVLAQAVFLDDAGETEPDFKRQNVGRQRECMAAGLCQVCARTVPWSRRNLVLAPESVKWVSLHQGGPELPVVVEPWLDDRCADIAVNWCPALIRRRRDEELTIVKVRSRREVELVVSYGWAEGHLETQTKAGSVAMWLKVALLNHRILRPKDLDG